MTSDSQQPWQWRVPLSRGSHCLLWWFALVLYLLTGGFTLFASLTYWALMNDRGGYILEFMGALPVKYTPVVIASYAIVAVFCGRSLFKMVRVSIRLRRLAFYGELQPEKGNSQQISTSRPNRLKALASSVYTALCTRRGFCGVDSKHFDLVFLAREFVEILMQTYQCYKSSWLLSQAWMNRLSVMVLATNCWCTPLLALISTKDMSKQRFFYLLADIVLDFASSIAVPISIIVNLLNDPRGAARAKPGVVYLFDVPFDDVYLIELMLSTKQVVSMNWFDLVSKILPIYSIVNCLNKVQIVAQRDKVDAPDLGSTFAMRIAPAPAVTSGMKSLTLRANNQLHLLATSTTRALLRFQLVLAAWGIAVVVIHFDATSRSAGTTSTSLMGCRSRVYPWFVSRPSCSVIELNCYQRGFSGSKQDVDVVLAQMEPLALSSLIITHCPALSIPPRIQTLKNLMGFEITNSSLVEWGDDAAFHDANHPTLHFLSLVRMDLKVIPDGLLADDFPHAVRGISIVATNLSSVPDDLDVVWHKAINLYLERNQFREIPEAVARMHVERLSMLGNLITEIPEDLLDGNAFHVLSVARNPLKRLPASIGSLARLSGLVLDHTLLDELPPWMYELRSKSPMTISAGATPYCAEQPDEAAQNKVLCGVRPDEDFEAYAFSYNLVDRRAVN